MTGDKVKQLAELCRPVAKFLQDNCSPHETVIITDSSFKMTSDVAGMPLDNPYKGTKSAMQKAIEEIGAVVSTFSYSSACQTHDCIQEQKTGDCFGLSDYIAVEFAKRGIRAVIYEYPTSVARHHQVKYESNGQLIEFPYSQYVKDHTFYSESIPDDASIFKEYGPGNLTGTKMSNTTTGSNSTNNNSEENSDENTN